MLNRYEQFSFVMSSIYRCIQKIERDEMVKYGCKGAYTQYLIALYNNPQGLTSAQLCEICDKDKAAVSRIITEMVQKKLIDRSGENIYRAVLLLTEDGKKAAEYVVKKVTTAVSIVGSSLTEQERELMYKLLKNIYSKILKIAQDGIPEDSKEIL